VKPSEAVALFVQPSLNDAALIVVGVLTVRGPVYGGDDSLGVLPSVVYRVVAPGVFVVIVTAWPTLYVPVPGLMVGVFTVNVYVAVRRSLGGSVGDHARAVNVIVRSTVTGPLTAGYVSSGMEPSVL
jgi:hypothetical protein